MIGRRRRKPSYRVLKSPYLPRTAIVMASDIVRVSLPVEFNFDLLGDDQRDRLKEEMRRAVDAFVDSLVVEDRPDEEDGVLVAETSQQEMNRIARETNTRPL